MITTIHFVIMLPDRQLAHLDGSPLPALFRGPLAAHQGARRNTAITRYAVAPATVHDANGNVMIRVEARNLHWVDARACTVKM